MAIYCAAAERGGLTQKKRIESSWVKLNVGRPNKISSVTNAGYRTVTARCDQLSMQVPGTRHSYFIIIFFYLKLFVYI